MPKSTLGGDDQKHELPPDEIERLERALRAEAREFLKAGKTKDSKKLNNRAKNISRRASKKADHH
jgi:hypothetical protein